jgi:hypothetical protein
MPHNSMAVEDGEEKINISSTLFDHSFDFLDEL